MTIKFSDLVFETGPHPDLRRARVNGYSIINGPLLHGGNTNLYEVMDLDGECHGYLTPHEVEDMINKE